MSSPTVAHMEERVAEACAARHVAGVVLMAADRSGRFRYTKSFGSQSLADDGATIPMTEHSAMWLASCTKLATSVAAMQCVEAGLIALDDDVRTTALLHELADIEILRPDGSLVPNTKPITLRQLLSHTSGFAYEFNEPLIRDLRGRFLHPLVFEPGTSWAYSPSTHWVGVLVERLSGLQLDDYLTRHIWKPLGFKGPTFFLSQRPDLRDRLARMAERPEGGISAVVQDAAEQPALAPEAMDCLGGGGLFGSPADFFALVHAVLKAATSSGTGTDNNTPVLLRPETARAMFAPQLGSEAARAALRQVAAVPVLNRMMGDMPLETTKDWGLAGLITLDDIPGWRSAGTLTWGGLPNLTWFIDPTAGLCGLYATQLLPVGDELSVKLTQMFERAMYAELKRQEQ
ncbi:acyltransferase LovD [Echria macrotheca]|uniref:Acyltransferase LovD n=1 Tax=Echria macrotheca TaxID=438768 RepID=A0AAJ0B1J5_9PEZI|nr:acyltransferase LovD [Echria macrotheca]